MKLQEPSFDKLNSSSAKDAYKRVWLKYFKPDPINAEVNIKNANISSNTKNLYLNAIIWIIRDLKLEDKISLPKLVRASVMSDKVPLTNNQIDKIRWEFKFSSEYFQKMFIFLIETGLRIEEISLINQVNRPQNIFFVKGAKGNKDRYIPLPQLTKIDDILLCENKLDYQQFYRECKRIGRFINQPLSPHTLRYTFATTRMYENGVPLEVISQLMGHDSVETTLRYIKFSFVNAQSHFKKQYLNDFETMKNKDAEFQTEYYKRLYLETLSKLEKAINENKPTN